MAFRKGGTAAARAAMMDDVARLWERNLGRDGRVVAACGCEIIFPFLDSRAVSYVLALPISDIVDTTWREDKSIFRRVCTHLTAKGLTCVLLSPLTITNLLDFSPPSRRAHTHSQIAAAFGLHAAATRVKQAMQFGSRSAKVLASRSGTTTASTRSP